MRHRLNHFAHVVILIVDGCSHCAFAITLIHPFGSLLYKLLATFKAFAVVVADDVGEGSMLYVALNIKQVVEAFKLYSLFGCFGNRHLCSKFGCYTSCIDHFVLSITRMNTYTFYFDFGTCCVKVFVFKFA